MTVLAALALIALGTYAFRVAGPLLQQRAGLREGHRLLLLDAATILLMALAATSTVLQAGGFAGWARVLGVAAGSALVLCRAPLIVVLPAGIGLTALARAFGLP